MLPDLRDKIEPAPRFVPRVQNTVQMERQRVRILPAKVVRGVIRSGVRSIIEGKD